MNNIHVLQRGRGSGYMPSRKAITLAFERGVDEAKEEELHKQFADTLTHEFIHYLLHKEFNLTISKLFDAIEQYFRIYPEILNNIYKGVSWHEWIAQHGYDAFHHRYNITNYDMDKAREVANRRF